ncbi:hypothetical protein VTO42DRAFT_4671 [Malbranchea cinnamomea]
MEFGLVFILRVVQALFALIVLGLTGHLVNVAWFTPSELGFNLFNSIWTFFIVVPFLVLAPVYAPALAHKYGLLASEAITTIFWFAGFIAMAAELDDVGDCRGNNFCSEWKAATAFGAFEFALFLGTVIYIYVLPLIRGRNKSATTAEPNPGV